MNLGKCTSISVAPSVNMENLSFLNNAHGRAGLEEQEGSSNCTTIEDIDIDLKEMYFLIMQVLSAGPCQKAVSQLWDELMDHELLPRRYHAWYSRSGAPSEDGCGDGISFPLNYNNLVERYSHVEKHHLVKLLKQLILSVAPPLRYVIGRSAPSAADVPTLLGIGSFSLLSDDRNKVKEQTKHPPPYLRWPHMKADQVHALSLREIGGGFPKHHRAPSIRFACYAIAKPSTMVQRMQPIKRLRGHRDAVYCAIFDRSGRYVITGSDDRLVKIWSMETAFCLASCRGHEGDITDLAVSTNNALVASASNDFNIRVWRLPDGLPISVLRGHTGAVTAIAFNPRPSSVYQLLSSSDDGTCRIWDARYSQCIPRIYLPKPTVPIAGKGSAPPSDGVSSATNAPHQILCCAYNANGTVFVTGSSDTYARVWSTCKSNTDDPEQPSHEIDLLPGHENDVNYVQFSGCAVTVRSSTSDCFRNSCFSQDNIVTCSRDGSAIIWVPKSRRSHGKVGRWGKAYHLKVPPPPMPPQPPRGGPRQRFLPTPRGVNMIVWSLDNRFVLAAIMDNRICVWNANDGSLVHCLTGHTQSTYVLDVHPFNPRIAMSAGYDGKTILWDIWEGSPIRIYEIGRFKLVDGKFSQDGTSIVLSDDVGQIYFLSTGQGESQKDAKYDQFFLGDYRPLVQDANSNVLDQETQLSPYRRNIQDLLCDSSMLPYPEPYQSMFQRRRLGALGIEWRPSPIKFAIGTEIGLDQYQLQPLADLDVVIEPLPEFIDPMYWEPENDIVNGDTDSEYNVTEEYSSPDEHGCLSNSSFSDPDCSEEEKVRRKDGLRRSKRKKSLSEVDVMTSSRRCIKKKFLNEHDVSSSRNKRTKKSRNIRSKSKMLSSKLSLRPQRVAARNAINNFSLTSDVSTDGDDEYVSEDDSSEKESPLGSDGEEKEFDDIMQNERLLKGKQVVLDESEYLGNPPMNVEPPVNENRRRLILKFSIRDSKKSVPSEGLRTQHENRAELSPLSSEPGGGTPSENAGISSVIVTDRGQLENCSNTDNVNSNVLHNEHSATTQTSGRYTSNYGTPSNGNNHVKSEDDNINSACSEIGNQENMFSIKAEVDGEHPGINLQTITDGTGNKEKVPVGVGQTLLPSTEKPKPKPTILKIKSKMLGDSKCPKVEASPSGVVCADENAQREKSQWPRVVLKYNAGKISESTTIPSTQDKEERSEFPDAATDVARRKRSLILRATSLETTSKKFDLSEGYVPTSRSRSSENQPKGVIDHFPSKVGTSSSKINVGIRSTKIRGEGFYNEGGNAPSIRDSDYMERKSNWLLLCEHEEGYRYIPQLGDEVVYLRQGHQEYLESSRSLQSGPWARYGKIRAVEICLVVDLQYATSSGSGESCCHIILQFNDPTCNAFGQKFRLVLPELNDFPDFVVERSRYTASVERGWTCRDKCLVWWRDECGGSWWEGRIVSIKDKSSDFPDSPWDRYTISYKGDSASSHLHSPWELHDPDIPWEHPQIDSRSRNYLLSSFAKLHQSASRDQDMLGILKLNQVAWKLDFINRYPVPLSPDVVRLRLENNYYRSLKAVTHDVTVMLTNAENYFARNAGLIKKMKCLSDCLLEICDNCEH